jgi:5'-3' exonuclease
MLNVGGMTIADGHPLLPAACALALMPRPALQHAPTALQHLMGRDSPISDVYDECSECVQLRTSEAAVQLVCRTSVHD